MKRESSRCLIFKDNKVLLIYRERDGEKYYVFPGGKIEENETKEECIIRECKEELGITVKPIKYIYQVIGEDFIQHFFLCKWLDGKIGSGNQEEYNPKRKGGLQKPTFVDVKEMLDLNVISKEIKIQLLSDLAKHGETLEIMLKILLNNKNYNLYCKNIDFYIFL